MTSTRRFTLMVMAAASVTIASSRRADAQILYPFPPYGSAVHDSSVRFDVMPRQAEVYVDGYYAGIVDEFDGMLQRLRVAPGQHEIALYHDGYRTVRQRVYLARDRTFKIRQQMEPLAPGEVGEARPVPAAIPTGVQPPRPLPRDPRVEPPPDAPPSNALPLTGRLSIRVQPADAEVVIDGQPWPAGQRQDAIVLDVPEGRHVVQVRKQGYVGYLTEVEVRRGETATVNVTLRTQP